VGKGGTADTDSTIEAKSLPTIYEDIMVDFGFDMFKEITMNSTVFWVVTPCISKRARSGLIASLTLSQ
jgi:hypothetical protein